MHWQRFTSFSFSLLHSARTAVPGKMASRLTTAFTTGKRPVFVAFLTAGYPTLDTTVPAMLAMQRNGVGLIEVGMPFSDPLADGGTIAKANQGALENGVTLKWTLGMIREARAAGVTVPIVLMGVSVGKRPAWGCAASAPPFFFSPSTFRTPHPAAADTSTLTPSWRTAWRR